MTDVGQVPAVVTGGGGDFGSDGGWLGMLLVIALLGGGNFGMGGRAGISNEFQYEALNTNMQAGFNQVTTQANFDTVDLALQAIQGAVNAGNFQNALLNKDNQIATIASDNAINRNIDQLRFDMANGFCTTNRNIDAVRWDSERNTNAIIQNATANTQRVIDWLCANEQRISYTKIAELQADKNKLEIITAMKPKEAIPAYLQPSPYQPYTTVPYPYPLGAGIGYFNNAV